MTTHPAPEGGLIAIVDTRDRIIGSEDRQIAREKGLIHRIAKVIITNQENHILIQQRSASKEDSPLKWDVSATGHVDAGEDYLEAALRETREEVGISDIHLTLIGKYYYERPKDRLMLRRFNSIFIGKTSEAVTLNTSEVAQVRWISPDDLLNWLEAHPEDFVLSCVEIFNQFSKRILGSKIVDHSGTN